jgi:signal transduction histidine kinase
LQSEYGNGITNSMADRILATVITLGLVTAIILFAIKYQRASYKNQLKMKDFINAQQIQAFEVALNAEERQKKAISRNLHDTINPILTITHLGIQASLKENPLRVTAETLQIWDNSIEECIKNIRGICYDLSPLTLENLGFKKAIEHILFNIQKSGIAQTHFIYDSTSANIIESLQNHHLNLYRVLQELLNNILVHSRATQINIELKHQNDAVQLVITYNGNGLEPGKLEEFKQKGLGLNSIDSRLLLMKGKIEYKKLDQDENLSIISLPIGDT